MPERVNVLVVGAGTHGDRSHLGSILQMPDLAQVVAVADNQSERLEELGRQYGLGDDVLKTEWTEIIGDSNIHAVVGALPDAMHMELAEAAIGAGKHLLGEKPLATTREEYGRQSICAPRECVAYRPARAMPGTDDRASHLRH